MDEMRRLSSQSVSRSDFFEPLTAVDSPENMLRRSSSAHETAVAMESARRRLAMGSGGSTPEDSSPATPDGSGLKTAEDYAFAFDIDGVLVKGGTIIPEAVTAMKVLNGENQFGVKV